jgi:hypothetical protein
MPDTRSTPDRECPFLLPAIADRPWRDPTRLYCRRADGRVRVPAQTTVACICATAAHLVCPGFLAGSTPTPGRVPAAAAVLRDLEWPGAECGRARPMQHVSRR